MDTQHGGSDREALIGRNCTDEGPPVRSPEQFGKMHTGKGASWNMRGNMNPTPRGQPAGNER